MKLDTYEIAQVAHEINRAYCESIGDDSEWDWEETTLEEKYSCLGAVEFHMKNKNATPEDDHNDWMKNKINDGWSYSEIENEVMKQHPFLKSFAELPQKHKTKLYLIKAVVRTLMNIEES